MDDDTRVKNTSSLWKRCAFSVGFHVCSNVGLVLLVIVYTLFGAVLFTFLEGDYYHQNQHGQQDNAAGTSAGTQQRATLIQHSRDECLRELWTITERLNVLYERNWTKLVHEQLRKFENNVVAATRTHTNNNIANNDYALDPTTTVASSTQSTQSTQPQWSFSSALLYSVTVITTIGYGNLSPKTAEGKVVTMIYAAIGVPLMLVCLSSLGQVLAKAVQFAYLRLLCCGSTRRDCRRRSNESTGEDSAASSSYQRGTHHGDKLYSYKYQRAPSSPARQTCTTSHETSVIQLAETHSNNKSCLTPKKSALATVNTRSGRCRLTTRSLPNPSACTTPAAPVPAEITRLHATECPTHAHHFRPPEPPPPPEIEDAEETDDTELGNSTHNTPSRIPLIWRQESKRIDSSSSQNHHHNNKPVSVPVVIVLLVLTAYLCIGAVIFAAWENWSFLDATYFCFITLSTIGFGDLIPGKTFPSADTYGHLQLIACSAYLLLGLVLVAMSFSLVHDEVVMKCKQFTRAIGLNH